MSKPATTSAIATCLPNELESPLSEPSSLNRPFPRTPSFPAASTRWLPTRAPASAFARKIAVCPSYTSPSSGTRIPMRVPAPRFRCHFIVPSKAQQTFTIASIPTPRPESSVTFVLRAQPWKANQLHEILTHTRIDAQLIGLSRSRSQSTPGPSSSTVTTKRPRRSRSPRE